MTVLTCEKCQTKFEVPSAALVGGRKVRCKNCKHIWFQEDPKAPVKQEAVQTAGSGSFADNMAESMARQGGQSVPPTLARDEEGLQLDDDAPPRKLSTKTILIVMALLALIAVLIAVASTPHIKTNETPVEAVSNAEFVLTNGYSWVEQRGDADVLMVTTDILNTSLGAQKIPPIQVILRNDQEVLQSWSPRSENVTLKPGEKHTLKWGFTDIEDTDGKIALYFDEY